MKSIKEFNTNGMTLFEREDLFKTTNPIPIGEWVYQSGDAWDYTKSVQVTEENQKEISMFWNSIYFDNEDKADEVTRYRHAAYGSYCASIWN